MNDRTAVPPVPAPEGAGGSSRQAILGRLRRAAPAQAKPRPDLARYRSGPIGRGFTSAPDDLQARVDAFTKAATGWRAEVHRVAAADVPRQVAAVLQAHGCQRVVVGEALPWWGGETPEQMMQAMGGTLTRFVQPLTDRDWKHTLFDGIDAGITGAVAGLVDTGTLLLVPGPGEPRTVSLVPPVHIALVRTVDLQPGLPAAFDAHVLDRPLPTNVVLVTGPSKTSDIQQTLAFGAHGPKVLVIVLVDDEPTSAAAAPEAV